MPAFFCKKLAFFGKSSTIAQINRMRAALELFSSVFSFLRYKVIVNENISLIGNASGKRFPDGSKVAINQTTICRYDVILNIFDVIMFLSSILVTDPSFMLLS